MSCVPDTVKLPSAGPWESHPRLQWEEIIEIISLMSYLYRHKELGKKCNPEGKKEKGGWK